MAMNGTTMGDEVWTELVAGGFVVDDDDNKGKAAWEAICGKIVAHIQNNAAVSTTVASGITCAVDPVSHNGATTGTGSGSGTVG